MKTLLLIAAACAILAAFDLLCRPWTIPAGRHFDVLEDDAEANWRFFDDDRR